MARPYSLDLRERVVSAVASGQTCRSVASNFDVAVATVVKWVGRFRRTGIQHLFKDCLAFLIAFAQFRCLPPML